MLKYSTLPGSGSKKKLVGTKKRCGKRSSRLRGSKWLTQARLRDAWALQGSIVSSDDHVRIRSARKKIGPRALHNANACGLPEDYFIDIDDVDLIIDNKQWPILGR